MNTLTFKTNELQGAALDWAVAKCEGSKVLIPVEEHLTDGHLPYCFDLIHDIKMYWEAVDILAGKPHRSGIGADELRTFAAEMGYVIDKPTYLQYSTNWELGGQIIEREMIQLTPHCMVNPLHGWAASFRSFDEDDCIFAAHRMRGKTPLIAAMRCYVSSKFGDTVKIPEELLK